MSLDAIVVGSGFGGAFAADHLVRSGLRVALVERGPFRDTAPMREAGIEDRSPLPRGRHALTHLLRQVAGSALPGCGWRASSRGLFDLHLQRDMSVVCSSGVGGGSHVYTAMNVRPERRGLWDGHAEGVDDATLAPRYEEAVARMRARPPRPGEGVPNFTGDRFVDDPLLAADPDLAQPPMGFRFERGVFRDNGVLGSPDGTKVTLDEILVVPAMDLGLEVLALHEVIDFGPSARGWRVTLVDHRTRSYRHLEAPRLLLGAGTLNTLRLLFAARARGAVGAMEGLGHGFGGNGDMLGYWARDEAGADYSVGTPCHGRMTVRGRPGVPYLTSFGLDGVDAVPLPGRWRRRLERDVLLVGMGGDEANGRASFRKGKLRFHYRVEDNPVLARTAEVFDHLAAASGRPVHYARRRPVTVHPLGGARVDRDPQRGVLDGAGRAHGLPGLYVVDASALPAAPGCPPSMSIAAWALHVARGIAQRG